MTESEWLACSDPQRMVTYLTHGTYEHGHGRSVCVTDRKLRLLSCACLRASERSPGVSVKSWNEFLEDVEQLDPIKDKEPVEFGSMMYLIRQLTAVELAEWTTQDCGLAADLVRDIFGNPFRPALLFREYVQNDDLVRDIFGNPFRPALLFREYVQNDERVVDFDRDRNAEALDQYRSWKACLRWREGMIPRMAEDIYERRDYTLLPVLADALEESGCTAEPVLRHLRGEEQCPKHPIVELPEGVGPVMCGKCLGNRGWVPLRGPHVRGCWALDLVLGKE